MTSDDRANPQNPSAKPIPSDDQSQPPAKPTMGEGSYEATRYYQKSVGEYLRKADVKADAEAARPRSDEEARELQSAEREGRSHAKTERGDDRMDDQKQIRGS